MSYLSDDSTTLSQLTENIRKPGTAQSSTGVGAPGVKDVQGIVLAGSHAWGDCVVKEVVSQLQLPVVGLPLLGHMLNWFKSVGADTTTLCANSQTKRLYKSFGESWGSEMDLHYLEDRMPRGPAGCVKDAASCLDGDAFVVVECGVLPLISLQDVLTLHQESQAQLTLVLVRREDRLGSNTESVSGGNIHCEPGGIYIFSREVLEMVSDKGYQDIKEMLIPKLHKQGAKIAAYETPARLLPRIKGAASYLSVNNWMLEQAVHHRAVPHDYQLHGEALIHRTARLGDGVELVGPVMLGPGAVLGKKSLIVGPTTLDEGSKVGSGAVVSRSALWKESHVGDGAVVDQSIMTQGAYVEPGLTIREGIGVRSPHRQSRISAINKITRNRGETLAQGSSSTQGEKI